MQQPADLPRQRVPPERLERELDKVEDPRDPPIPVTAWLLLDGREWDGVLHGWADSPNGGGGLAGLVVVEREYAPGFWTEAILWVRAEDIQRR